MGKRYVGKGWEKKFDNGGAVINISVKIADLNKLTPTAYGEVCLTVEQRKEPDLKSKATHNVIVDEYRHKD